MKKVLLLGSLLLVGGCKKNIPPTNTEDASPSSMSSQQGSASVSVATQWKPAVDGQPYQLAFQNGKFIFCDDRGGQQIDLATGQQSAKTQSCDAKHEVLQSCDDKPQGIMITSPSDAANDSLIVDGKGYELEGRGLACDNDGLIAIAATDSAIDVVDGKAEKLTIVDKTGGDKVAIGSGWVAWHSSDEKGTLHLISVSKALERATKK